MSNITKISIRLMLDMYSKYQEVQELSARCLTVDQRKVLLHHTYHAFCDLAKIYLADYLSACEYGYCLLEVLYDHTEPDTNADIYNDLRIKASSYKELLSVFNFTEEFSQQQDHGEEWRILTKHFHAVEHKDGSESFTGRTNNNYLEEYELMELLFVKHLKLELLNEG